MATDTIANEHARRMLNDIISEIVYPFQPIVSPDTRITLEEMLTKQLKSFASAVQLPAAGRGS